MFKPNPDSVGLEAGKTTTTGQTFSLIMNYMKYGSLMQRLDAGRAKSKESPPILRCSHLDWTDPNKMFIGVDDWELKLHLALGIARGIHAMHSECVWHRDLKSSNVLIDEYHPVHVHHHHIRSYIQNEPILYSYSCHPVVYVFLPSSCHAGLFGNCSCP